jgi:hypothetical protein
MGAVAVFGPGTVIPLAAQALCRAILERVEAR